MRFSVANLNVMLANTFANWVKKLKPEKQKIAMLTAAKLSHANKLFMQGHLKRAKSMSNEIQSALDKLTNTIYNA